MANYTDPTSRPVDPGVAQPDPRVGEAGAPGTFAESELEYSRTERAGVAYDQPGSFGSEELHRRDCQSEAANVKDTAAGAASGVKEVARRGCPRSGRGEVPNQESYGPDTI